MVLCCHVGDYDNAGRKVQQTHQEDTLDEAEKHSVVGLSNAVVQPLAMVIKVTNAAVAGTAVLRVVKNMGVAHFTVVLVFRVVEVFAKQQLNILDEMGAYFYNRASFSALMVGSDGSLLVVKTPK